MARIRTAFPTREIPHLWAHQTVAHARNASGNLYFNGPTIYSYGSHFPIARLVVSEVGRAVLFNSGGYSVTTSKQQGNVRRAIPCGFRVLTVPLVPGQYDADNARAGDNLSALVDGVRASLAKAYRARGNRDWHLTEARKSADDALFFAKFFRLPAPSFPALDLVGAKAIADAARRVAEEQTRQRKAREERHRAGLEEGMGEWLRGERPVAPYAHPDTRLRVSPGDPDTVQTSKGASFPLDHARKLWPLLCRMRAKSERYQRNGHSLHLGDFVLDSFDGATGELVAGCHRLQWDELVRFARVIGLDVPEEVRAAA